MTKSFPLSVSKDIRYIFCTLLGIQLLSRFVPLLRNLLSLSWAGLTKGFLWQCFTYPLPIAYNGKISLWNLLSLFFLLYVFVAMAIPLIKQWGRKTFYQLLVCVTGVSGLIGMVYIAMTSYIYPVATLSPLLQGLLVVSLLHKAATEKRLHLQRTSFSLTTVLFVCLGVHLFLLLLNYAFLEFFMTLSAVVTAYLFSIKRLGLVSGLSQLQPFENRLLQKKGKKASSAKIYSIHTGKAVNAHSDFIDKCLEKISKNGYKSLSLYERIRLKYLSKKRYFS